MPGTFVILKLANGYMYVLRDKTGRELLSGGANMGKGVMEKTLRTVEWVRTNAECDSNYERYQALGGPSFVLIEKGVRFGGPTNKYSNSQAVENDIDIIKLTVPTAKIEHKTKEAYNLSKMGLLQKVRFLLKK